MYMILFAYAEYIDTKYLTMDPVKIELIDEIITA